MDISDTLASNSDQLDAADLTQEGRVFTVTGVNVTNGDQPVNVQLAEFPRVWRPAKTVRRLLAAGWGTDSSQWVGRRVHLYNDESVKWAGQAVGGIRIKAMSGLDGPLERTLPVTRGKYGKFTVQPLTDVPAQAPQTDWTARLAAVKGDPDAAQALYTEAQQAGAPDNYLAAVRAAAGQEQ